jgi:hypothetical protein
MIRRLFSAVSALLLSCLICITYGGCGVVFIPTVQTYPDPVKTIELRDAASGSLISGGDVRFLIEPDEYKGYPWDNRSAWASVASAFPGGEGGQMLPVIYSTKGRFAPERKVSLAFW